MIGPRLVVDQLVHFKRLGLLHTGKILGIKNPYMMPAVYSVREGVHGDGPNQVEAYASELETVRHHPDWKYSVGDDLCHGSAGDCVRVVGLLRVGVNRLYEVAESATADSPYPSYRRVFQEHCRKSTDKPDNSNCPRCGDRGEWRALALVCRNGHGVFAG